MTTTLKDVQERFQDCLLGGPDALELIEEGARETRERLLGVYRHAYGARLRDVLATDYEQLHGYLGDQGFARLAAAYIAAHPSRFSNARWVGEFLPGFLRQTQPWSARVELAELAQLEHALSAVFDAADELALDLAELAAVSGDDWPQLRFRPLAATRRLSFDSNATAIWSALKDGNAPPAVATGERQQLLVYRQEYQSRFRPLGGEEAMMWDEMAKGVPFGQLCELVATYGGEDDAAARAAACLGGWIAAGIVSALPAG